ncbi:hypothetical protein EYR41_001766 [Orbilia oligospora]|uniref:Uncharacterized protein n=1 Tax=Orbilia oligospora TaxID=2813651 RepID=A0A8H2ECW0_ORBOL|nr:hypothetical protein TWF217_011378 [Orbilia oligospora]KAF3292086.1 hypothetical protein TWF132_006326 [Orbilia oligospora]TGJ74802.1 hypothetical protein EYR41_001766 [Orbilia oligospora]
MHELPSYPGAYVKNHDNRYDPATSVYQSLTTPETSSRYRSLEPLKVLVILQLIQAQA